MASIVIVHISTMAVENIRLRLADGTFCSFILATLLADLATIWQSETLAVADDLMRILYDMNLRI